MTALHEETYKGVTIRLYIEEEDHSPRDDFSGPDSEAMVKEILTRLNQWGDLWAWCCVKVEAEFGGFRGHEYLGGCSYKDTKDFIADGYYADMRDAAIEDLKRTMDAAIEKGNKARATLAALFKEGS